jgi:hypothetical protein
VVTLLLHKSLLNKANSTWTTFSIVVLLKWRLVVLCLYFGSRQDATNPTNQCDPDFAPGPDYENAWNDLIVDVCHNEPNIFIFDEPIL